MGQMTTAYLGSLVRRDKRRRKFWSAMGDLVAEWIADAALAFVRGWLLMLAVGIAHAEWLPKLPTIGYWWAVLLVWLLSGFLPQRAKPKGETP